MIWLAIEAPFAACRPMMAGWHRPAAGFLTHSAAYGLVLNVAGVESRLGEHEPGHPGDVPASLTRPGLPSFRVALGLPAGSDLPRVGTVFQQLHNYSVAAGNAGIRPEHALGRKNNIAPVRRELLSGLRAIVAVQAEDDLTEAVRHGLLGGRNGRRYGLPFLGDNSFTLDRLEEVEPRPALWFVLAETASRGGPRAGTTRLTAYVDRRTPVGTRSALFAPVAEEDASETPPETALVPVGDPRAFDEWSGRHRLG
jgi:CRISPR-associated protein Cas5t